jgi:hypothetical protein
VPDAVNDGIEPEAGAACKADFARSQAPIVKNSPRQIFDR